MSFTQGGNGTQRGNGGEFGRTVTSIPLSDANPSGSASFGSLVRDATEQMSTLVRAEVELAKAEVTAEVKKGLQGSVYFIAALTILLFSLFFFFFFIAELLDVWLYRWAAFGIVFLAMLIATGACAFLGWRKVKKLRAPQKTIDSLKEARTVLPQSLGAHDERPALEKAVKPAS